MGGGGGWGGGGGVFIVGVNGVHVHAEPNQSKLSSGLGGVASSGHLRNSARDTQSSVAVSDGLSPRAPPHSIEFSCQDKRDTERERWIETHRKRVRKRARDREMEW